jgi:PHD/YefM family antitoxin component YafN of YafNO toxin-antitoxin module
MSDITYTQDCMDFDQNSLEGYNAIKETFYLLRSPRNAERLLEALHEAERKDFVKYTLIEE